MATQNPKVLLLSLLALIAGNAPGVLAEEDKHTLQQQLNQEVMAQPLTTVEEATLRQSLEEATKRGQPSKSTTKTGYYQYWHNGYYYPYAAYRLHYWY